MDRWEHQALEMSQIATEAGSKEGLLPTVGLPYAATTSTLLLKLLQPKSERLTQISWERIHCR